MLHKSQLSYARPIFSTRRLSISILLLLGRVYFFRSSLCKGTYLNIYKEILFARAVRTEALVYLKAKGACATQ